MQTHRRDQLIEFFKTILSTNFVLNSQPTTVYETIVDARLDSDRNVTVTEMAERMRQRYAETMGDLERLVNDHRYHEREGEPNRSKLKLLVPSVGKLFTSLPLRDAFLYQDAKRHISSRRFVAPSFNDVRIILNTAQLMSLVEHGPLELVTFDGDVTLYDDGQSLTEENPVIPHILDLMRRGVNVGIVTAAGYTDAEKYYARLRGLLDALANSDMSQKHKDSLIVLGGESNFLFRYDEREESKLRYVPRREWILPEMQSWTEELIQNVLNVAEAALDDCVRNMNLPAQILRKERAVGIVPKPGCRLIREQLEETVLVTQKILEMSPAGQRLPFCAFNGGNDVFVDIGDKSWGVLVCQKVFGGISGSRSLHVGDQFLSAGANDFKARLASTTAWIASPEETVQLLDELREHSESHKLRS